MTSRFYLVEGSMNWYNSNMQKLFIIKEYKHTDATDPVQDFVNNVMTGLPDDLRIAILAGCKIDATFEGTKMTIKTHYPISILKDQKGRVIDVYEKRT